MVSYVQMRSNSNDFHISVSMSHVCTQNSNQAGETPQPAPLTQLQEYNMQSVLCKPLRFCFNYCAECK